VELQRKWFFLGVEDANSQIPFYFDFLIAGKDFLHSQKKIVSIVASSRRSAQPSLEIDIALCCQIFEGIVEICVDMVGVKACTQKKSSQKSKNESQLDFFQD